MDWITKLIKALKIPLKVLLPALCVFSGILLFATDELLLKMNLLDWSKENGFIFGLLFLISLSFIIVYVLYFIKNQAHDILFRITLNRKTFKKIVQLNTAEQAVLAKLYNSPAYTAKMDFNQPIIKGLLSRKFIYSGEMQLVEANIYTNAVAINVTLQPFVWKALDKYLPVLKEELNGYPARITKAKTEEKKEALRNAQENILNFCNLFDGKLF